jgi:hypothetical protein
MDPLYWQLVYAASPAIGFSIAASIYNAQTATTNLHVLLSCWLSPAQLHHPSMVLWESLPFRLLVGSPHWASSRDPCIGPFCGSPTFVLLVALPHQASSLHLSSPSCSRLHQGCIAIDSHILPAHGPAVSAATRPLWPSTSCQPNLHMCWSCGTLKSTH